MSRSRFPKPSVRGALDEGPTAVARGSPPRWRPGRRACSPRPGSRPHLEAYVSGEKRPTPWVQRGDREGGWRGAGALVADSGFRRPHRGSFDDHAGRRAATTQPWAGGVSRGARTRMRSFDMTEKWAGRPAAEILAEAWVPAQVYVWRRARGESQDGALQQIIEQSGFSNPFNVEQLTRRCLAAEARELEGATPKPQPRIFQAEILTYQCIARTGGRYESSRSNGRSRSALPSRQGELAAARAAALPRSSSSISLGPRWMSTRSRPTRHRA